MNTVKFLSALSLFLAFSYTQAQVKAELVYPVIAIEDDCHYAFDDTTTNRIISLEEFRKLDRIWTTYNSCFGMEEDTIFISSYTLVIQSINGRTSTMSYEKQ